MRKFFLQSKVVLAALFVQLAASADQFAVIDWRAILVFLGLPEPSLAGVLQIISLVFLVLRLVGGNLRLSTAKTEDSDQ